MQNGGKLFLNYNLGSKDITIGDILTKVNDGRYHVVRFTRSDTNSSMQVDDNPIHTKFPQGIYLINIFNDRGIWNRLNHRQTIYLTENFISLILYKIISIVTYTQ